MLTATSASGRLPFLAAQCQLVSQVSAVEAGESLGPCVLSAVPRDIALTQVTKGRPLHSPWVYVSAHVHDLPGSNGKHSGGEGITHLLPLTSMGLDF